MSKTVDYYMNLQYKTEIIRNEDGSFFASVKELPGCFTEGDTIEEVYNMIEDAKKSWIITALEKNMDIPLPEINTVKNYSGKFMIRIPKLLHKKLSENAEKD